MTDEPVDLDQHRGMAAQKATNMRRLVSEVEANLKDLRHRQDELESQHGRSGSELGRSQREGALYSESLRGHG